LQEDDADLQALFKDYSDDVSKLAKQTAMRADEMEKKDMAFFRTWQEQIAEIQDPDIQKLAKRRHDKRMKSYRKMTASMSEAQIAFVPFLIPGKTSRNC
jgi:Protein of unknown function (DUF2959)